MSWYTMDESRAHRKRIRAIIAALGFRGTTSLVGLLRLLTSDDPNGRHT